MEGSAPVVTAPSQETELSSSSYGPSARAADASGTGGVSEPVLTENQQKAHFSWGYVQAIASQAGHWISAVPQDVDALAFDVTLEFGPTGLRLQLKCSAVERFNQKGTLQFPVERTWVAKWKQNRNPTYCVLIMVSPAIDDWLKVTGHRSKDAPVPASTHVMASAYWTRVDNIEDGAKSITFDRRHRFTAATVRRWREDLDRGYGKGGPYSA